MKTSMLRCSASMQAAMLPLASTTNTRSATPLVLARIHGSGASGTGSAMPAGVPLRTMGSTGLSIGSLIGMGGVSTSEGAGGKKGGGDGGTGTGAGVSVTGAVADAGFSVAFMR